MDNSSFVPRFDAYAATLQAPPADVLDALEGLTPGAAWDRLARAPHGYGFGARLVDAEGQLGQVWWGGRHESPHATFQGDASPAAAALMRECFPAHAVARADVIAFESAEPGAFNRVQAACLEVAAAQRVKVGTAGDHLLTMDGRTVYYGSRKAAVLVRQYDKAAELRAKLRDPARLAAVPPELVRFEMQLRPHGAEAKRAAAVASPVELLGSARWLRSMLQVVAGLNVEPFQARPLWRESDVEASWWWMLRQFRHVLRSKHADAGSAECLGLQIVHDLDQVDLHPKRRP